MGISKNATWLRKVSYAPLTAAVLAGALCSGTGTGTAAADAATDAPTASTAAAPGTAIDWHWWSLYNDTGQPIYGTWSEQVGSTVSELDLVSKWPLQNDGHESRPRVDNGWVGSPYWMGHICYAHKWWNHPRQERVLSADATFTLEAKDGGLQVTWKKRYYETSQKEAMILNPHEAPC
ncbi:hypothetical protein R3Q06_33180 [Rhodococcus erythropolis]|uniref:hypothetical protein n=1 Tax=Rhodococcus erythropolis TaxID=1833 RepID=UPI00294A5FF8|nr:hypothetical protein [Rhodococcus erythropolis]MDV6278299.1 hypothetical protein [Rhodococcus erythropolis]